LIRIKKLGKFIALSNHSLIGEYSTRGGIEDTLKAIKIRNKIVHEGLNPQGAESKNILMGLFRTISSLLLGPEFKFPELN
jgi:hypothetical protein